MFSQFLTELMLQLHTVAFCSKFKGLKVGACPVYAWDRQGEMVAADSASLPLH